MISSKALFEKKIAFLRRNAELAHSVFDEIKDPDRYHTTDPARNLVRLARKDCGYSKHTSPVDICASLLKVWVTLGHSNGAK
jgi:hypothetical protein